MAVGLGDWPSVSREWPRESRVEYGVVVPKFGDNTEARMLAALARDREGAGWETASFSETIPFAWLMPIADPWTALSPIVLATERIPLGT